MTPNTTPSISIRWVVAGLALLVAAAWLLVVEMEPDRTVFIPGGRESLPERTAGADGIQCWAEPGYASRVVRVQPDNGVISAFEPIIVEVELTNTSSAPVSVYYSNDLSIRIEVRDSDGSLVGGSPVYPRGDEVSFAYALGPTRSMRAFFIPSAVYRFKDPGRYSVRIMLLRPPGKVTYKPSDLGPVRAEATVPVTVLPFDETKLMARCDEVIKLQRERPRVYPTHADMLALWSVRHKAALPALKFIAQNCGDSSYGWPTAEAIQRVGTRESAALLKALALRKDRMGRAARSAEKADLRVHDDDYFTGWEIDLPPVLVPLRV